MKHTALIAVLGALALSACTTANPFSPQASSGITTVEMEKKPDGSFKAYVRDGKNAGKKRVLATMPDGTRIEFEGEQIDGATAQAQQAATNAAIMERLAGSADKLIEKIPAVVP